MKNNNKNNERHKAPEGYFDSFNERLLERMRSEGIDTQSSAKSPLRISWLKPAIAAASVITIAVIALLLWNRKPSNPGNEIVKTNTVKADSLSKQEIASVQETNQNQLISIIDEELSEPEPKSPIIQTSHSPEEQALEKELEELGLTGGESGEELFGDLEI